VLRREGVGIYFILSITIGKELLDESGSDILLLPIG
jgi:hypothetical protein